MDRAAQFAVVSAREAWPTAALDSPRWTRRRIGVSVGSAVGAHDEPGAGVPGGQRRRPAMGGGPPPTPCRTCTTTSCPARSPPRSPGRSAPRARPPWCPPAAPPGLDSRRLRRRADPGGQRRRRDRGRRRRADLADHRGLLRRDQGHHAAQRRPRARLAAVRPHRATASCSARARPCSSWRNYERARARGAHDLRRDRRLRHPLQRLPHDRAAPGRPRDGRGDPRRAGRGADDPRGVDYINAHGSGTKQNDRHETAAFKRSLGEHAYRVPVSSIKSMVGHSLGAIGSIEIAACALAIEHDVVPPTANLHEPRPRVRPRLRAADRPRAPHSTRC